MKSVQNDNLFLEIHYKLLSKTKTMTINYEL
jgi:hypothetical protein